MYHLAIEKIKKNSKPIFKSEYHTKKKKRSTIDPESKEFLNIHNLSNKSKKLMRAVIYCFVIKQSSNCSILIHNA